MSERHFIDLEDRTLLSLEGEDRVAFLQGLVSNDVAKADGGRAIWAAFLTPQGKFLHDFFIAASGDRLLLSPEASRADDLFKRLTLYKLRSKVTLGRPGWRVVALQGEGLTEALGLAAAPGSAAPWQGGVAFLDPRLEGAGAFAFLPAEDFEAKLEAAGFVRGTRAAYEERRIALGLPDGSRDLEVERTALLEAGFDELQGVDWKKGCYMGQELTARTKYRGLVKRRLLPLRLEGPDLEPGAEVQQAGKPVGVLRSVAGGLALAELRLSALGAEAPLESGETRLHPAPPAWLALP
jgi:folate-binding protein YgfZ